MTELTNRGTALPFVLMAESALGTFSVKSGKERNREKHQDAQMSAVTAMLQERQKNSTESPT